MANGLARVGFEGSQTKGQWLEVWKGSMNGVLSPLLARIRLNKVRPLLTGKILDYGCSEGRLIEFINGNEYVGVDVDPGTLNRARSIHPGMRFILADDLPALDEHFDTIVSVATLGLVPDQVGFLRDMRNKLTKGGKIVLTTPHPRVNILHKLGGQLRLFGNDFGYERTSQLPDEAQMQTLAEAAGLAVDRSASFMLGANQLFVLSAADS